GWRAGLRRGFLHRRAVQVVGRLEQIAAAGLLPGHQLGLGGRCGGGGRLALLDAGEEVLLGHAPTAPRTLHLLHALQRDAVLGGGVRDRWRDAGRGSRRRGGTLGLLVLGGCRDRRRCRGFGFGGGGRLSRFV